MLEGRQDPEFETVDIVHAYIVVAIYVHSSVIGLHGGAEEV